MITFDMLGKYGEFGNQLFQIAATSVLAKRNNTTAVFPKWVCGKQFKVYSHVLKNPLDETLNLSDISTVYNEQGHQYQDIPFVPNMSLRGFYQSEQYFNGEHDFVRSLLQPAQHIEDEITKKYSDIVNASDTVAVHIRTQTRSRDDAPKIHLKPPTEYLQQAFKTFGKNHRFVVFSDNIPLVQQWFKGYDFTFIENGTPFNNPPPGQIINQPIYDNVLELYLMSKCKNAITTSSSFGWWGAWLQSNTSKTVVAMHPDNWFGPELKHLDLKDLIPKSWITINPVNG